MGEFARNIVVRGGYRLVPWWCRRGPYRPIVTRFAKSHRPVPDVPADLPSADGDYEVEWGEFSTRARA